MSGKGKKISYKTMWQELQVLYRDALVEGDRLGNEVKDLQMLYDECIHTIDDLSQQLEESKLKEKATTQKRLLRRFGFSDGNTNTNTNTNTNNTKLHNTITDDSLFLSGPYAVSMNRIEEVAKLNTIITTQSEQISRLQLDIALLSESNNILKTHLTTSTSTAYIQDVYVNVWCYSRLLGNSYKYSIVCIRDKVVHVGCYYNVSKEFGDLCMLANVMVFYGSNICICSDSEHIRLLFTNREARKSIPADCTPIACDLVSKGIMRCGFRYVSSSQLHSGYIVAKWYTETCEGNTHSSEWTVVRLG